MNGHQLIGGVTPFLKLHEGRWADVFKAYDASLERYVLLKVLNHKTAGNAAMARQFEAEARLMARIQHPNIVPVLSYGKENESIYLTTAFVDGFSLREILDKRRPIPPIVGLQMLYEMAMGLQAAHQQNILHRDLKPANVMLATEGHLQITDFGMAALNQADHQTTSEVVGTLAYLAPELITGTSASVQSDLFALGVTFYEMLAGRLPFRGEATSEIFDNILHYDPLPLLKANATIPPGMVTLCTHLLEKDTAVRIKSTETLIREIIDLRRDLQYVDGSENLKRFASAPEAYEEQIEAVRPPMVSAPEPVSRDRKSIVHRTQKAIPTRVSRHIRVTLPVALLVLAAIVFYQMNTTESDTVQNNAFQSKIAEQEPHPEAMQPTDTPPQKIEMESEEPAASTLGPPQVENRVATAEDINTSQTAISPNQSSATESSAIDSTISTSETIQFADTRPGEIDILCTPWCEVEINGKPYGQAPPAITAKLDPGTYELKLSNPHYPMYAHTLTIQPAHKDSLRLAFKDLVATLELEVFPWAEVIIDSVSYGTIPPVQTIVLSPGAHVLTLKHDELGVWSTQLIVAAGEQRRQPYNLQELLKNAPAHKSN